MVGVILEERLVVPTAQLQVRIRRAERRPLARRRQACESSPQANTLSQGKVRKHGLRPLFWSIQAAVGVPRSELVELWGFP